MKFRKVINKDIFFYREDIFNVAYKINIIFIFLLILIDNGKSYFQHIKYNFLYPIKKQEQSLLKIFIVAHKDFKNNRHNPVYNIVVDDKSQLKNNYSNITIFYANEGKLYNMNRAYSEMSQIDYIYQLYKKGTLSSKYIGFNHYRRYFNFTDNIPNIEDIFKHYDVILNQPAFIPEGIKKQFCNFHICEKYDQILSIIKELKPEYYKIALKNSRKKIIYFFNLFIMKKEDFFKYCEFMYDILFEFDRRNNFKNDSDVLNYTKMYYNNTGNFYYQSRLQAFLSERIGNIFYNKHFKRKVSF